MSASNSGGKVYFIGAGAGDPELLTRKAWKLLTTAEMVLHDALVPHEILELAPVAAILCSVGKRCGQKSIAQEEIHALLIQHARAGRAVVRLQGGDPLIFGRAGEEIAALEDAGIEFEIVPGVTAASAAAAAARISLTQRGVASKLILISAHRGAGEAPTDWSSLPPCGATLAIYMPGRHYEEIARELIAAGWSAGTPCIIVSHAGLPQQAVTHLELSQLASEHELVTAILAPAILLVGEVAKGAALESAVASAAGAFQAKP